MADTARTDRVRAALAALTDEELDGAVHALGDGEHLGTLAQALNLKRPALSSIATPSEIVRPRLATGAPARLAYAALAIAGPCSDACIAGLGDASDDPSREEMVAVLPDLVERFGAPMVTLMLAAYPMIDAPCTAVFEELLDHDERFTIGPPADTKWAGVHAHAVVVDEASVDRARRERDARIAAEAQRRRKQRRR
jgi:hypothetical protein